MTQPNQISIPKEILDQAIDWVVKTHVSGELDEQIRIDCDTWRKTDPLNEIAWQELQGIEQEFDKIPANLPTGLAIKTISNATQAQINDKRRKALKLLGLGAIGIGTGWVTAKTIPWYRVDADYATATGESREFQLADGTQLKLNTNTVVDIKYTSDRRLIVLHEGEIMISTGKDTGATTSSRPFWVITPNGSLQALGTKFFVRKEDNKTRLYVEEGAVAIYDQHLLKVAIAKPAEEFVFTGNEVEQITASNFDVSAWIDGVLVAKQMRLADFIAELSRYRKGWLRCDPNVTDLLVSGVFQLDDTDRVLDAITHSLPVQIETRTKYWVMVTPKQA